MDPKRPDAADYADLPVSQTGFYVDAAAVKALPAAGRPSGAIAAVDEDRDLKP
jgi:hypothetical protein